MWMKTVLLLYSLDKNMNRNYIYIIQFTSVGLAQVCPKYNYLSLNHQLSLFNYTKVTCTVVITITENEITVLNLALQPYCLHIELHPAVVRLGSSPHASLSSLAVCIVLLQQVKYIQNPVCVYLKMLVTNAHTWKETSESTSLV